MFGSAPALSPTAGMCASTTVMDRTPSGDDKMLSGASSVNMRSSEFKTNVACGLVIIGALIAFGLVRIAADLTIVLIISGTCGVMCYQITSGVWVEWVEIGWRSLAGGGIAALLALPVLPFSSFRRRS